MEIKTIDFLIDRINEIVPKASAESHRINVLTYVRHVFSEIGFEFLAEYCTFDIQIVGGKWPIPKDIVDIIDVGSTPYGFDGTRMGAAYFAGPGLNYRKGPIQLDFPGVPDTTVYGLGYRFYKDEDGNLIIPEDAYQACYDYSAWQSVKNSNNPKNPLWNDRQVMKNESVMSINMARGFFNKPDNATFRTFRKLS